MLQMTDERVRAGLFHEEILFLLHGSVVKAVVISRLEMRIQLRETSVLCS
jgi:hypothetical protein